MSDRWMISKTMVLVVIASALLTVAVLDSDHTEQPVHPSWSDIDACAAELRACRGIGRDVAPTGDSYKVRLPGQGGVATGALAHDTFSVSCDQAVSISIDSREDAECVVTNMKDKRSPTPVASDWYEAANVFYENAPTSEYLHYFYTE